jgi:hypothetical protein
MNSNSRKRNRVTYAKTFREFEAAFRVKSQYWFPTVIMQIEIVHSVIRFCKEPLIVIQKVRLFVRISFKSSCDLGLGVSER